MERYRERLKLQEEQAEWGAAIVSLNIAAWSGHVKKGAKLKYSEFMPSRTAQAPADDPVASLRAFFSARAEAQKQQAIKGERLR